MTNWAEIEGWGSSVEETGKWKSWKGEEVNLGSALIIHIRRKNIPISYQHSFECAQTKAFFCDFLLWFEFRALISILLLTSTSTSPSDNAKADILSLL